MSSLSAKALETDLLLPIDSAKGLLAELPNIMDDKYDLTGEQVGAIISKIIELTPSPSDCHNPEDTTKTNAQLQRCVNLILSKYAYLIAPEDQTALISYGLLNNPESPTLVSTVYPPAPAELSFIERCIQIHCEPDDDKASKLISTLNAEIEVKYKIEDRDTALEFLRNTDILHITPETFDSVSHFCAESKTIQALFKYWQDFSILSGTSGTFQILLIQLNCLAFESYTDNLFFDLQDFVNFNTTLLLKNQYMALVLPIILEHIMHIPSLNHDIPARYFKFLQSPLESPLYYYISIIDIGHQYNIIIRKKTDYYNLNGHLLYNETLYDKTLKNQNLISYLSEDPKGAALAIIIGSALIKLKAAFRSQEIGLNLLCIAAQYDDRAHPFIKSSVKDGTMTQFISGQLIPKFERKLKRYPEMFAELAEPICAQVICRKKYLQQFKKAMVTYCENTGNPNKFRESARKAILTIIDAKKIRQQILNTATVFVHSTPEAEAERAEVLDHYLLLLEDKGAGAVI